MRLRNPFFVLIGRLLLMVHVNVLLSSLDIHKADLGHSKTICCQCVFPLSIFYLKVFDEFAKENYAFRAAQATQRLTHFVPPEKYTAEARHAGQNPQQQTSNYNTHRGWNGDQPLTAERCGVLYISQGWCQQGHSKEVSTAI